MISLQVKAARPASDETLSALERLYQAMLISQNLMKDAAAEHWQSFHQQMREAIGVEAIHLDEPYLDAEITKFQLQLMETLERVFNRIAYPLLGEKQHPPEYYPAFAMYGLPIKAINYDAVAVTDIEDRIAIESVRATRRLKQSLDEKRQRNFGMEFYVWRTVGDDKVRDAHAALNGKLCRWDEGIRPGEDYGCRCYAEPSAQGIDDPPIEPVYPELWLIAFGRALRGIVTLLTRVKDKLDKVRQKPEMSAAKEPKDILNPNGNPIGKPGKRPEIREVDGGTEAARKLYEELTKNGVTEQRGNYPGESKRLPNGDWIGYRKSSKSGPATIDLDVRDIPYTKIKFLK